ncbi:UNVERIFIED_CONTAM: hypothetical protein FKN15_002656 [Acipenser sinensis]
MSDVTEEDSHDIRIHLEKLQRRQKVVDLAFVYRNQISCLLKILKKIHNPHTTDEAHDLFMNAYPNIFLKPKMKLPRIPIMEKKTDISTNRICLRWKRRTVPRIVIRLRAEQESNSNAQCLRINLGAVLVKEGEVSPFAGYIKSGQSNILRDIGAFVKRPLGKLGIRVKHVIICKLIENESFGEVSILLNQPSTCTIVTETEVELGVILPSALQSLDSVTQALMLQTAQPTFEELTQEEINKKYLSQEKQKEWEHFKEEINKKYLSQEKQKEWEHFKDIEKQLGFSFLFTAASSLPFQCH